MRCAVRLVALAGVTLAAACGAGQPAPPPQQQVDVVGIRSELLAIGQAERQYLVAHSTYATLDELQQDHLLTGGANRRGYEFSAQIDGDQGFTVTAVPSDPDKQHWPTLAIDQTMQVSER
jgi:hypothetical protein